MHSLLRLSTATMLMVAAVSLASRQTLVGVVLTAAPFLILAGRRVPPSDRWRFLALSILVFATWAAVGL
jgi:hypothetical protein